MIRESRTFFNQQTNHYEVWLSFILGKWCVRDVGDGEPEEYPDTDEGYRAAQLDYGRRVTQRVYGDDQRPGVYWGPDNVTPETIDIVIESADNCYEHLAARLDAPRVRSFVRWMTHWLEHGSIPEDKTGEEWLFIRAWPTGMNKAREAARRVFQALKAEWADRPDTHPLLAELATEHPWIEKEPA